MKIYSIGKDWIVAQGRVNKRLVFGAGTTPTKALVDALKS